MFLRLVALHVLKLLVSW